MNPDILSHKERCASTSNLHFQGRQSAEGRTYLVSPVMAAAAPIVGKVADDRKMAGRDTATAKSRPKMDLGPEVPEIDIDDDLDLLLDLPEVCQPHANSGTTGSTGVQAKFITVKGITALMERANVDTDTVIRKQFLKTIKRTSLGSASFYSLRYNEDGTDNSNFVLKKEPYRQRGSPYSNRDQLRLRQLSQTCALGAA